MRNYEIMFIVRPTISEDEIKKVAASFKDILEAQGSKVTGTDEWGQKPFAYDIKTRSGLYKSGYYYVYQVEADNDAGIKEFDRLAGINADIIRHLIIRKED